jgi:uncharacterized protein YbaP (TraB family)
MGRNSIAKRKRWQSLFICFLICFATFWVSINTAFAQAGAQQKKDFLWSLKTDKATIYLLGSIHLLQADAYPLDKNIEAAYKNSTRICFETDINAAQDPT